MSTGVKALIAVVVIGGLLYWYSMSSTPVPANAPNGAGSLPPPDNTTSGGTLANTSPTSNGPVISTAPNPVDRGPQPNTVGVLAGIKLPAPKASTSGTVDISTYIPALIKRVPSLAGTDALSVNPTTGYLSPTSTAAALAERARENSSGSGAAGTSSTGYHAAPAPAAPTVSYPTGGGALYTNKV